MRISTYIRNKDKIVTEEQAFAYHKIRYKLHTFKIRSLEEYTTMRPFIIMLGVENVKIISTPKLKDTDFEKLYEAACMRNHKAEVRKLKKESEGLADIWGENSRYNPANNMELVNESKSIKINSKTARRELRHLQLNSGRKI